MSVAVPDKGVYAVVFQVHAPAEVGLGALGSHTFEPGWLVFVGRVSKGLGGRLARHAHYDKKPRWHIDRVTQSAATTAAWAAVFPDLADDGEASRRLGAALHMRPAVPAYQADDGVTRLWWRRAAPSPVAVGGALGQMPVLVRSLSALDGR